MATPVHCRTCGHLHDPLMPCPPVVHRADYRDAEIVRLRAHVAELEKGLTDRRRRKADAQKRWRDGKKGTRETAA